MTRLATSWPWLPVMAAAVLFATTSWAVNGHLVVFSDTMAYVRQGEFWGSLLHIGPLLGDPSPHAEHISLMSSALAKYGPSITTVAAARSPFYGLFLYAVGGMGSLWAVVFVQALAAAWLLRLTTRLILTPPTDAAYGMLIATLTVGTSLPFFVNFAMPDVFGGLGYLAAILLLVAFDRLSGRDRVSLWLLVTIAILFHRANAPVIFCIAIAGWGLLKRAELPTRRPARPTATILSAIAVAALASTLVQEVFHRETGYVLGSPPFVMARILIDGPGKDYLDATCPGGVSPTLCRFKDRPMNQEGDVLWRSEGGVFGSADYATRRQLQKDEIAFLIASIKFEPWLTLHAELQNWATQSLLVFVDDPLMSPARLLADPDTDDAALKYLQPTLRPCVAKGGCQGVSIPTLRWALMCLHLPILLVSMIALIRCGTDLARRLKDESCDDETANHLRMVLNAGYLILFGVVINAACFGILSGPYARYQARVIWLIPMAAVLGACVVRRFQTKRTREQEAESLRPVRV